MEVLLGLTPDMLLDLYSEGSRGDLKSKDEGLTSQVLWTHVILCVRGLWMMLAG